MYTLIVCTDEAFGIGMKDGSIPFHNSADMKEFKKRTLHNVVIMGRKTWESLPIKPLPLRINIIISSSFLYIDKKMYQNVLHFFSIQDCITMLQTNFTDKEKYVIGGASIYNYFIQHHLIDTFYHTIVHTNYNCDINILNYHLFYTLIPITSNEVNEINDCLQKKSVDKYKWSYKMYKVKK